MIPLLLIGSIFLSFIFPKEQSAYFQAGIKSGEKILLQDLFGELVITGTESDTVEIRQYFTTPVLPEKDLLDSQLTQSDTAIIFTPDRQLNRSIAVHYKISIPTDATLDLNVLGGSIQLRDMRALLNISSAGGEISAENIIGPLTVNTGGGSVRLKNIVGEVICNTGGGIVNISQTKGPLQIFSGGGDIIINSIQGNCTTTTLNGSISISGGKGTVMRCKTGGGNLALEKMDMELIQLDNASGDIYLKTISGSVICKIGNGDLSAENITGKLKIQNLNGDSDIIQLQGSLTLEEINGNIKLERFHPVSDQAGTSSIYCQNGDIILDYYGENVSIEAVSYQGRIMSNILSEISKYPAKAVYLPEVVEHEINIGSKNGKIIVNKRRESE